MCILIFIGSIVIIGILLYGVSLWLQVKDFYDRPGCFGIPVIGNLYYYCTTLRFKNVESFMNYYGKISDKYGESSWHWLMGSRVLVVSCPQITEKLAYHQNLADKPVALYQGETPFNKGPFTSVKADDQWKQRRKEINHSLKKNVIENSYHRVFIKAGRNMIKHIISTPKFDPEYLSNYLTLSVTLETHAHVTDLSILDSAALRRSKILVRMGSNMMVDPFIAGKLIRCLKFMEKIVLGKVIQLRELALETAKDIIKKHEKGSSPYKEQMELPLTANMLLRIKRNNEPLEEFYKELNELGAVSSHTVAVALSGCIVFLAVLPKIQEKAWEEQMSIFGTNPRDPTIDDMKQMPYLDRFLREALRFFSPPTISRYTKGEINEDGLVIPANTVVLFLQHKMRFDSKYWKNPKIFNPDRFLNENFPKYSYMPFGFGLRSCPGMTYALNEMKVVLSLMLRRVKVTCAKKFEDLKFDYNLMTGIENTPLLQFEERE